MKHEIRFSALAAADLENIVAFIAEDNSAAAAAFYAEIRKQIDLLGDFPEIGSRPNSYVLRDRRCRCCVYGDYVIIYSFEQEKSIVTIRRILHGAMLHGLIDT